MYSRRVVLSIVTAAVMLAAGCGRVDEDKGSAKAAPDSGTSSAAAGEEASHKDIADDVHLEAARQVISEFYACVSEGRYSDMSALCSESLAKYYGYDEMEDGENISQVSVEFSEEDKAVVTDIDGGTLAVWLVSIQNEDASPTDCYMAVKYENGEYRINDIAYYTEDGSAEKFVDEKLKENAEHYLLMLLMGAASVQMKTQEEYNVLADGELYPDGEYKSGDGSKFIEAVESEAETFFGDDSGYGDKTAKEYMDKADSVEYTIIIEDGTVVRGTVKATAGERVCEVTLPE